MADRIKLLRERAGLSQAKFGEQFDVSREAVSQWENGGNIDPSRLVRISERYNVSLGWIAGREPLVDINSPPGSQRFVADTSQGRVSFPRETHAIFPWPKDLRVLGFVKAGKVGYYPTNGETLEMTERPPMLASVPDAYAVYVDDTSMVPAFKPGFVAWVHPRRPAVPGDNIIIQLTDGQAFIKELVRRTEKHLICQQWNPKEEVRYETGRIKAVHLVVGSGIGR